MSEAKTLPAITTSRLVLRMLTEDDCDAVYRIFSDPDVMRFWSCEPYTDKAQADELIRNCKAGFDSREFFQWGIANAEDDKIIGTCTLYALDKKNLRSEIGFALARPYWGKGYMHETLEALFAFAFEPLGMHRIEADVDPRNERCIATLEKLGFQREGYMRERWFVAGERQDSVFYGLLHADWLAAAPEQPRADASNA
ncbi:MAG: GNAT family N-acetyltransferase [Planctomycetota bacterium]|jgi:RimJ/RimL family protein N-acetyltransferase|nr:GNAT family N-acetyltransferase [Planctomycetota bacterium]